ncbi:hypothetical protein P5P86_11775 [Nocardioides sp. BP30]|uniref:hypothetical protein n=1 Tax=Nocardioides sp. BP30 TaxID=3036374 RepID=UPI00246925B2|nr:hypothetical protein [Nocardioides sp. BP30]WGL50643.1 hypothetical protein P5P86_11775 [Nocardioides sp. BP30]
MGTSIDGAFTALVDLLSDATITMADHVLPVDNVSAFVLNPVAPPFIEVLPSIANGYLSFDDEGLNFGNAVLHMTVLVAVPSADNDVVVGQINDLILQIAAAIAPSALFWVVNVASPQGVEAGNQIYPGVAIEVAAQIPLI